MNEEDLKKFIEFTKTLLSKLHGKNEHAWFFDSFNLEIINTFFLNGSNVSGLDKFQSISESDISRIKAYLSFIDKTALNYGKKFYSKISDRNLKVELIKDFREMKIALKNDDFIEFGRRLSLQLENIFNFSLSSINVHNLISANKQQYLAVIPNWPNYQGEPFNFFKPFFSLNQHSNQYEPVELSRVSFKTKSIFLSIHFNYPVSSKSINEIYFLRNLGSHRDQLSPEDQLLLKNIISDFDKKYSSYHKVLFDVVGGIANI